ncbi:hypothetical protein [Synechococcus phage S-H34]|uniref:Uncharacterized protein n=1 Tax=Synechococcus phage S-H34 TaxID=2718942 RepID=A0A6G8R6J3_9CAUD|nr:hypothetical protein PQC15_gp146 [Synechococcus phage S-H34]QIN97017.1 hypothetical protein [Synechococcus phage S-H34]
MPAKRLIVTRELINSCLPDTPEGYTRTIEKVSATIYRVVLHHPDRYTYKQGVTTDWGFIKGRVVYRPKSGKASTEKVCDLLDANELSGYTCIIPTCTDLTHIK